MRSSGQRRTRLLAAGAVLTAIGGVIGFTQLASADENSTKAGESGAGKVVGNNLTILTDTCVDSDLPAHDGFQRGERCVSTEFGEVGAAANNPTLLITRAPDDVTVGTPFTLQVSTRNLIRDRFLAAGQGGYYVESSVLQNGLVRGHFHTACRMLTSTEEAPESAPVPAFFVATEDRRGGADPDTVTIQVPGLPQEGIAQCSSWAGDGSHRIPMMERANQTPALDSVRITVRADNGGQNGGGNDNGGNNGGGQNNGGNNNGGGQNNGGGNNNGGNDTNNGGVTPTTPPTSAPPTTKATTRPTKPSTTKPTTATPNRTTVTATPRTNSTTTTTGGGETAGTSGNNGGTATSEPKDETTTGTTGGSSNENENSGSDETTAPTKKPTKKATAQPEFDPEPEATETDGPALAGDPGDGAPDEPESTSDTVAEPPAQQSGPIALVSNNLAWIGGGAVLVLVGLVIAAFMRTRPRSWN
ncbi:cell division septation protein DedD [Actinoplanes campanulatus]|uniref:Cell division septation protein DedD n=1 Tax=Actinoplanes campanulatus TaxID=113559 RepID=A0A7W5FC27_9ACTN|nr:cell division septation protein DedD [Actinoplanes campanulatus]GGM99022.1 hypothetical protein GCM10010109_03470 [Actinoplanes campanulatus]GID34118.1 hypothetical protein Aca09nite_06240 [Actinoplanes campanulatus]